MALEQPDHLGQEERVAAGAFGQPPDRRVREPLSGRYLHEGVDVAGPESFQIHAPDAAMAARAAEMGRQVRRARLIDPVCRQQHHRHVGDLAREMLDEPQRRRVRPVQVVDGSPTVS
jgi:hypothetical protein